MRAALDEVITKKVPLELYWLVAASPQGCPAVADGNKANGTNAMERLLAHYEFVGIRRRGPLSLQVHIASIVHVAAKARMRFQPASVGQVDRTRSNIITRGAAIIVPQ